MPPQGSKSAYSSKQRRQARHIEDSEMKRGRSRGSAERIGWATVNKQDGGARGRKRKSTPSRSRTTGRRPTRRTSTTRSRNR